MPACRVCWRNDSPSEDKKSDEKHVLNSLLFFVV